MRRFDQLFVKRKLRKMKAADQSIGRRLYRDIEDSLMRATAEKDTLSILLNEKILLMSEIVGDKRVSYFSVNPFYKSNSAVLEDATFLT